MKQWLHQYFLIWMEEIKIAIVGDPESGKSWLVKSFLGKQNEAAYSPTTIQHDALKIITDSKKPGIQISLWEVGGSCVLSDLKAAAWGHADCFILCYRMRQKLSAQNIAQKWIPQILWYGDGPHVPVLLIGTDIKEDHEKDEETWKDEDNFSVFKIDCEDLRQRVNLVQCYICSQNSSSNNFQEIFEKAALLGRDKRLNDVIPFETWNFETLNVIVLGDGNVEKKDVLKSLLNTSSNDMSEKIDFKSGRLRYCNWQEGGKEYFVTIAEISDCCNISTEEKSTVYSKADCVLLCYNVRDRVSLLNAENIWINELKTILKVLPPIILIGTGDNLDDVIDDKPEVTEAGDELILRLNLSDHHVICNGDSQELKSLFKSILKHCNK